MEGAVALGDTTYGHTMEGWCTVHKKWGARSKCSLCGEMRAKIPGHLPDGFCSVLNKWDQSVLRRHSTDVPEAEEAAEPGAPQRQKHAEVNNRVQEWRGLKPVRTE